MNLSRIFAITQRIIAQFRRDHRTLGLIFIAPILIMTIFGYVFRSQEDQSVKLAVVNEDNPPAGQASLSAAVVGSLSTNSSLVLTTMSRDDATKAVRDGTEKAALIFGPDFTQNFATDHKGTIEILVEGSNPGASGSALGVVGQAVIGSAPLLLKAALPPALSAAAPSTLPIEIKATRLYGSADLKMLDFFAPIFIAYIGFFLIFLLTSVSFLRERTQGTMERLAASPVTRLELVLGYMFGFGFFSVLQAIVLLLFTIYALQVKYTGSLLAIFVVILALVIGAVNMGIFLSAYAKNELQAIQFIPIVILPQVVLSGLFWPVQDMPGWLQAIARIMPLTYAVDAMTNIMIRGMSLASTWWPLLFLFGFAALMAALAAATVRREVA
ncbi:MAG TPA: ABC transporter permease [Chloroflexia bacterium]|nr:ABC transporter permease [Chloroflexia bacterium]